MRPFLATILAASLLLSAAPGRAAPAKYELDPSHMAIGFLVMHIGYAKTLGMFREASGSFSFDETTGKVSDLRFVVQTASVFTNHDKRDGHLRGPDFLNVEKFPEMVFASSGFERTGARTGQLTGKLTLLGQTQPMALDVVWNKSGKYPFGGSAVTGPNYVTGISARGSFKRSAFGMNYAVENGWVGDEIELIIELEAIRQE